MIKFLRNLSPRPIVEWLRGHNYYRIAREKLVRGYLRRAIALNDPGSEISWQPLYYVVVKVVIVAILVWEVFRLHPILGGWLETGFRFFKFHEIYNFTFPARSFFDRIAAILAGIVLGYYGLYFLFYQLQALFSSIIVSRREKKIFYIKSLFVKKDLHMFSASELDFFVLKHNLLSRLFGIGTLVLSGKNGDLITVRGVGRAGRIMKEIAAAGAAAGTAVSEGK
jgi:hypothetical protein